MGRYHPVYCDDCDGVVDPGDFPGDTTCECTKTPQTGETEYRAWLHFDHGVSIDLGEWDGDDMGDYVGEWFMLPDGLIKRSSHVEVMVRHVSPWVLENVYEPDESIES